MTQASLTLVRDVGITAWSYGTTGRWDDYTMIHRRPD